MSVTNIMNPLTHWTRGFLLRSATQAPSARYLSCCPPLLAPTEDSEKTAARSKSREWNREWYRKRYPENQAFRESISAHAAKYQLKKASADPDWKQARKEQKAAWYKQKSCDAQYLARLWFRRWLVTKFSQGREGLIWETRVPILYEHKVRHTCSSCGYETRNGLKLWWQQISDPNIYKCHRCYCSPEVLKAMPVGYEDVYVKWWNTRPGSSETGSSSSQPSHAEDEKSNS